jgi:serine protease Do
MRSLLSSSLCFALCLGSAAAASRPPAPATDSVPNAFDAVGQEVNVLFEKAKTAVVRVRSESDKLTMSGTGFYIDNKGTVLTAAAIISENSVVTVESNGAWHLARVIGRDSRSGVALLQTDIGATPYLTLGKSAELKTGLSVVTVGFPRNLPVAPSYGQISGFDFRYLDKIFPTTHIRASVSVSPGQVGGPLLNSKGEVVGMLVTAIEEGRSVYALPAEAIEKIIGDFRHYGLARHGWVGVGVREVPGAHPGTPAVEISQLFDATPASVSGLASGDVVLKIGTRNITGPSDVMDASFFSNVGEETSVTVMRGGKTMVYKFTVKERPTAIPLIAVEAKPTLSPADPFPYLTQPEEPHPIQVKDTSR